MGKKSNDGYRRKRKLLDAALQFGLPGRLAVMSAGVFLLFVFLVLFVPVISGWLAGDPVLGLEESMHRAEELGLVAALPLFAALLALMGHGVLETHRIAGPAYRFKSVFAALADTGLLPKRVRLRNRDYLQGVALQVSRAFLRLHSDLNSLKDDLRRAEQQLEGLRGSVDVSAVESELESMRRTLESYTLEEEESAVERREASGNDAESLEVVLPQEESLAATAAP